MKNLLEILTLSHFTDYHQLLISSSKSNTINLKKDKTTIKKCQIYKLKFSTIKKRIEKIEIS